ncbi:MAG: DUF6044 family protein [Lachnospiraceae bacterium]
MIFFVHKIDEMPLAYLVFPLLVVALYYYIRLGKNCVFEINDQLDETLFTYVLNAKYMLQNVREYPELLGGVPAGGMTVSSWIFVPLYRILPVFQAFMVQFAIVMATAYLGMYLCVKELTDSSILGAICGTMFMFLPYQPVYGLSIVGGPLIFFAFLCIYKEKHLILSHILIWYFALGANLVLLGYVALGLVACVDIWIAFTKEKIKIRNKRFYLSTLELLVAYVLVNLSLFRELILGNGGYVSHREEMIVAGGDFWNSAKEVFLHSAQHAPSLHEKLILPILLVILIYGLLWKRLDRACRNIYIWLVTIFVVNLLVALFYGFCQSSIVVDFRNSVTGFLHYFSAYRVYWIYPTSWYVSLGLAAALVWKDHGKCPDILAGILILVLMVPIAWNIRQNSNWILNKSQYKNNCNVGLMSWKDYFAEDLMAEIRDAIQEETGMEQSEYRIASLGMCPAVPLEAGFYCIDGYSNNYSLEYKHQFREIIAKELDKCPDMRVYFDDWGSRCYLFTQESQNYYYLKKDADFQYQNLELDTGKMKQLGCDYLFSAAEIVPENAERLGISLQGVYDTEDSYYRIWVYKIK